MIFEKLVELIIENNYENSYIFVYINSKLILSYYNPIYLFFFLR